MKKLLLFTCFILSVNSYAYNLIAECNGCNDAQSRQKAIQYANNIPNGGFVYVFNFTYHDLKKYFTFRESLLNTVNFDSKDLIDKKLKHLEKLGIDKKQIVDIFDNSKVNLKSNSITIIIEVVPTPEEQVAFNDVDLLVDSFSPNIVENIPPTYTNPQTGGEMIGNYFGVYDLIGNSAMQAAILNQFHSSNQVSLAILYLEELATSMFQALNLNWNAEFKLILPDGSWGIAHFENDGLMFDENTFVDSDGNPVPVSPGDVSSRNYFFSEGSGNHGGFVARLWSLGVGYGSGRQCSGSCDANGCTVTCTRG